MKKDIGLKSEWIGERNGFCYKNDWQTIKGGESWSSRIIKFSMTIRRASWKRLSTQDGFSARTQEVPLNCHLCSREHLFFEYPYSKGIWDLIEPCKEGTKIQFNGHFW